jgi:ATP-dependent Lhr-like helicase
VAEPAGDQIAEREPARAAQRAGARLDPASLDRWFASQGWTVQPFQHRVWRAMRRGVSGLVHAETGSGKTLAVWFGALLRLSDKHSAGLQVLWITPMRALATDTRAALAAPLAALGIAREVELRTSDTSSAQRSRQLRKPPLALVTTPESLSLLIAQPEWRSFFASLSTVVVDEWHELIGSKRGVQVQLALQRLRGLGSACAVWGLSATLARPEEALEVLTGRPGGCLIRAPGRRVPIIDTMIPEAVERFPWAGHLGTRMLGQVVRALDAASTSLVFCNTRAQAEIWYQLLLDARPDWAGLIALHHGSLDREARHWVEENLGAGRLRAVVCTSTLDLGVDFAPVERVLQIGSAKAVARLLQRAGRSGHRPGGVSRATLVPTHALELLEAAAAREAVGRARIEPHRALEQPLDVLVQHLVTAALGEGFDEAELLAEVRGTHAYRYLDEGSWRWALDFVIQGGESLKAYPEYRKLVRDPDGRWRVPDAAIARRHRMSIGTIVAEAEVSVRAMNGSRLGSVEESFIGRLKPGDSFVFAGRVWELVRFRDMEAWVRRAKSERAAVSRWAGSRMPLSSELAQSMFEQLERLSGVSAAASSAPRPGPVNSERPLAGRGSPELDAIAPLIELQARRSRLPVRARLLIEQMTSREGHHVFVYPFAGRAAHLGLASLLAFRLARGKPATYSIAVNDYGFELLGAEPFDPAPFTSGELLSPNDLEPDLMAAINAAELIKRRFRETARIAGLLVQGRPGERRSARALQASAGLFHDVFARHDPDNRLLAQARAEVLERELDAPRIRACLEALSGQPVDFVPIERPTPFAFPLMVERLRERLSTEALGERIARMLAQAERGA